MQEAVEDKLVEDGSVKQVQSVAVPTDIGDVQSRVEEALSGIEAQEDQLITLFKNCPELRGREVDFVKAMTPEKLAALKKLKDPTIYWLEGDELVIGDGCCEVAEETRGMDYFTARNHCVSSGLQMLTLSEYEKLSERKVYEEMRTFTWLESGENTAYAFVARWERENCRVYHFKCDSTIQDNDRGVRRTLRVKLAA